ncbi:BREX-2 system adenine-specific DNA-methyltransferase PglX [Spirillospora sp. NPDC048911]|uniref:BREX-2 system adenine-specific DNA-methyltransferase PglX n=1 Tax=Spirillospora sp. NPDC048911 TaxID=3364527 RepID=UPI003712FD77
MIDPTALLNDLKPQVRALETDLRERAAEPPFKPSLEAEWRNAVDRERTAATYDTWLEGQLTQSAVAWTLSTVFLRFCEDNHLIDEVFLSGPGDRLELAKERQQAFFEHPENVAKTDREWIEEGVKAMAKASPVAAGLFDPDHNPMWRITPSLEAAKALITFWRQTRPDGETLIPIHHFEDSTWNTRFLGDLYQELSEHAKKTYALLQTPEFVEELILDLTLDPAIEEFGLDPEPPEACPAELNLPRGIRVIDPTCGSGHFLLGAFHRILDRWQRQAPAADKWDLIHRTLYSVHGVDKNPFAVAIARFRLLIAAMKAGDVNTLRETPDFALNIAVGDSLIHGRGGPQLDQGAWTFSSDGRLVETEPFIFSTEDVSDYIKSVDMLGISGYHVVFGNPPYITVKDKAENRSYRYYQSCSGAYALSVPFIERFFHLAVRGGRERKKSGYVGQITANSFMKREFGKKLVEEFLRTIKLSHVIDTSGAYIPGHGTPTVILAGRRITPHGEPVRAILGIRGEAGQPTSPRNGKVWLAIERAVKKAETDNEWVGLALLPQENFHSHPWSLGGGGAGELQESLTSASNSSLKDYAKDIGFGAVTREDSAYMLGEGALRRLGVPDGQQLALVEGEATRDWIITNPTASLWPYDPESLQASADEATVRVLWPNRTILRERIAYGKSQLERGLTWFEFSMFFKRRFKAQPSIAFAFVATHNHFVLDRGGKVFNRSTPVIKLSEGTNESDFLGILGLLNSSTACFWLKQVSQSKGGSGIGRGVQDEAWENRYEFTVTKLEKFPIPNGQLDTWCNQLDDIALKLAKTTPDQVCSHSVPSKDRLDLSHNEHQALRSEMIALQEELDWEVYCLYGLLTTEEAAELGTVPETVPGIKPGERAFEIVLARKIAVGQVETQWFARHGSSPITEVPAHWPEEYRRVVEKRIEIIESRPQTIGLIERPEYKRRWATEPWEKKEKAALRNWLLDRCEARELWFAPDETGVEQPRMMTIARLADRLRDDEDFVSVARLYAGDDADLIDVLTEIMDSEHVPFLAALRYKDSGMRKRSQWERTWEMQREEDATGKDLSIPLPPKYASADFLKNSYWRNRGKLDVPKERFISHPGASPDGDRSLLVGWAGWDHRRQAHALMTLIEERTTRDGWEVERLIPLLAGLAEVMPWVEQWHGDVDPAFGISPAAAYGGYFEQQMERHGLTEENLRSWRPPKGRRGRAPKKSEG